MDETEKGWFLQYIDRDPEAIRRQEQLVKKVCTGTITTEVGTGTITTVGLKCVQELLPYH